MPKCRECHFDNVQTDICSVCGADLREAAEPAPGAAAIEPPAAAVDPSRAIELAYGLLWHCKLDNRTWSGLAMQAARQVLLEQIDRDGQARGITLARTLLELRPGSK